MFANYYLQKYFICLYIQFFTTQPENRHMNNRKPYKTHEKEIEGKKEVANKPIQRCSSLLVINKIEI